MIVYPSDNTRQLLDTWYEGSPIELNYSNTITKDTEAVTQKINHVLDTSETQ